MGNVAHHMLVEEFYNSIIVDLYFDRCYALSLRELGGDLCVLGASSGKRCERSSRS
jgi:hypothetical protein